jgi:hypothetical protein
MISFKEFISESQDGAGLTIWDIDETLFRTTARVHIIKDGKIIKTLGNKQYNTYNLQPGESFDFSEFRDARHFQSTSEPIARAIRKLIAMHKNIKAKGSKMVVITARSDFDDRDIFLDTFRKQGIDIDDIHVHRAGNLGAMPSAAAKKIYIKQYLDTGKYTRARLFDDAVSNLQMFKDLANEYPNVKFEPFLAHEDGSMTRF